MTTGQIEFVLERHWTCNVCGASGIERSEHPSPAEACGGYCCGSTCIREVPGQMLFTDEGGAWVRSKAAS